MVHNLLGVWLPDEMKMEIIKEAERCSLSVSSYVRMLLAKREKIS